MPTLATIDMGTNTFHLLVAEVISSHALRRIGAERRMVRLGEGFSTEKRIRPEATVRAIAALIDFRSTLARFAVDDLSVIATSAARDAENQTAFLAAVKQATGFNVQVMTGEEEAHCTFTGVQMVIGNGGGMAGPIAVIDIGGGSTELIVAEGSEPAWVDSLPLGVVPLAETYLADDPLSPAALARMGQAIDATLDTLAHTPPPQCRFAGTAGTITTLAAMAQQMSSYAVEGINRYPLSRDFVAQTFMRLSSMTRAERRLRVGLDSGREDILVAGSLILLRVMQRFGWPTVYVSDAGVREGRLLRRYRECFTSPPTSINGQ